MPPQGEPAPSLPRTAASWHTTPPRDVCADHAIPDWVEVCGRRIFVVDHTPAGFPIGVFEDEMDRDWSDDLDTRPGDELF